MSIFNKTTLAALSVAAIISGACVMRGDVYPCQKPDTVSMALGQGSDGFHTCDYRA